MPGKKAISNPGGLWGETADTDSQLEVECVNNSGGTLLPGDCVALDVTGTLATTIAGANDKSICGVVLPAEGGIRTVASTETVASGAVMRVAIGGIARVNIAANAVAAKDILSQSAVAKVAVVNNAATVGQGIGIALEASGAKDANNTIRALIAKM